MQIKRAALIAALIAAIDTALNNNITAQNKYVRDVARWKADQVRDWKQTDMPKWRALRDVLTRRLRTGIPITNGVIKDALGGSVNDLVCPDRNPYSSEVPKPPSVNVDELKALRAALAAVTDDTLSMSALKALGFTSSKISGIFTTAVKAGGAA